LVYLGLSKVSFKAKPYYFLFTNGQSPPSTFKVFHWAILSTFVKSEGQLPRGVEEFPKSSCTITTKPSAKDIEKYTRLCSFQPSSSSKIIDNRVPICYPEVLSISSMVTLVTHSSFPLSAMGLIHIRNKITVFEKLPTIGETLNIVTKVSGHKVTDQGIEVNFCSELTADAKVIWSCEITLLSRNKATRSGKQPKKTHETPQEPIKPTLTFKVAGDAGRKYASVSGDYNPHHLYPLTAKLIGYPRPIAHGMWTLACSLNELPPPTLPCVIDTAWKRPLTMPSQATFTTTTENGNTSFAVYDRQGAPHLIGSISPYQS